MDSSSHGPFVSVAAAWQHSDHHLPLDPHDLPLDYHHIGDAAAKDAAEMLAHARNGDLVQVEAYVLGKGVSADSRSKEDGSSALHLAAAARATGGGDMIRFLIDKGAKADARDIQGFTALHCAATHASGLEAMKALLEKKPDLVNLRNAFGGMALHSAAAEGCLHSAVELVKRGADINAQQGDGNTALILAVHPSKRQDIAAFLAEAGADVSRKNNLGLSALHYAAMNNMPSLCDLLLRKGSFVDSRCDAGRTPLHLAAAEGNEEVARLLCDTWHASLMYDNNRQSQLDVAKKASPHLYEYLLDYGKRASARRREQQPQQQQQQPSSRPKAVTISIPKTPEQKSLDDLPSSPLARAAREHLREAHRQSTTTNNHDAQLSHCSALARERDELAALVQKERGEWSAKLAAMKLQLAQQESLMNEKDKEIARLTEMVKGAVAAKNFEVGRLERELAKSKHA